MVETTPAPTLKPSAEPSPELATEPEDAAAYCDAIQAVHDAPYAGPGRDNAEKVHATDLVVEVAPEDEKEYWRNVALVFDNTQDRDVHRAMVDRYREMDYRVRERCGFGLP